MTVRELYERTGGGYADAMGRFQNEARILKYSRKFPASVNPDELKAAIDSRDWTAAFRLAHTLKGVCLNMSYVTLSRYACELTELLRPGAPAEDPEPYYVRLRTEFDRVVGMIAELED